MSGRKSSNLFMSVLCIQYKYILRHCGITLCTRMCHRTTSTRPDRRNKFKDKNKEIRRNPFRNNIDCILIKRKDLPFVRNSCSYRGIGLNTDHKLVKAELQIGWFKMKISKKKEGINMDNFKHPRNQVKYQEKIQERLEKKEEGHDPSESCKNIREACTQIAKEALDRKDKNIRNQSKTVKDLSEAQKKIKLDKELLKIRIKRRPKKRKEQDHKYPSQRNREGRKRKTE